MIPDTFVFTGGIMYYFVIALIIIIIYLWIKINLL